MFSTATVQVRCIASAGHEEETLVLPLGLAFSSRWTVADLLQCVRKHVKRVPKEDIQELELDGPAGGRLDEDVLLGEVLKDGDTLRSRSLRADAPLLQEGSPVPQLSPQLATGSGNHENSDAHYARVSGATEAPGLAEESSEELSDESSRPPVPAPPLSPQPRTGRGNHRQSETDHARDFGATKAPGLKEEPVEESSDESPTSPMPPPPPPPQPATGRGDTDELEAHHARIFGGTDVPGSGEESAAEFSDESSTPPLPPHYNGRPPTTEAPPLEAPSASRGMWRRGFKDQSMATAAGRTRLSRSRSPASRTRCRLMPATHATHDDTAPKTGGREEKWPPLLRAVHDGDLQGAKRLLQDGADINCTMSRTGQKTPLYYAVRFVMPDFVRLFLSHPDVDVHREMKSGRGSNRTTPLKAAVEDGPRTSIYKAFVEAGFLPASGASKGHRKGAYGEALPESTRQEESTPGNPTTDLGCKGARKTGGFDQRSERTGNFAAAAVYGGISLSQRQASMAARRVAGHSKGGSPLVSNEACESAGQTRGAVYGGVSLADRRAAISRDMMR